MSRALLAAGGVAFGVAAAAEPGLARETAGRVWEPFVLVAGLLMIGLVAHRDGSFDAVAGRLSRLGGGPVVLLAALLLLTAVVSAVLNLDTAVAFLTPVLVLTARRRGIAETPFLYGAVFMSNSASLLLPGSNLTNLLVLADRGRSGAGFAVRMAPAWVVAITCTIGWLILRYRRALEPAASAPFSAPLPPPVRSAQPVAIAAIVGAALAVVVLSEPALPVLGLGLAVTTVRRCRLPEVLDAVNPAALIGLYAICVALGTLAGVWTAPGRSVATASAPGAAALGALASVLFNNLPAAVLLGSGPIAHPDGLLLGLNLGPNLAVTGSLSALLWFQAARSVGARPSAVTFSRLGIVLAPLSIGACLLSLALWPVGPL